jgi:hypothetical protein
MMMTNINKGFVFKYALWLSLAAASACSSSNIKQSGGGGGGTGGGNAGSGGGSGGGSAGSGGGSAGSGGGGGGTTANCPPSWTTTPACGGTPSGTAPDFGPNVLIFDPSMAMSDIQGQLDDKYNEQDSAQFGDSRYAYFFKPGNYNVDVKVGFYTQVLGLGQSPDDTSITGAVRAKADWLGSQNATCNFWRGAENLAVTPTQDNNVNVWAVSQGTHLRRMHIKGDINLDDGGWSSGGFVVDTLVDGNINSGSQQQFLTRNNDQNWNGQNWNMVFVGDPGAPSGDNWPNPPYTVTDATPVVREKPFLYVDAAGNYLVMVPSLKTNSQGHSWGDGSPPGSPLSIDRFYIAKADTDTSTTLNAALASGKHLLLTPGEYHLDSALAVTQPGTIILGLGIATLTAEKGDALITVADVDDVTLAGLLLEAGATNSTTLLQLGPDGSSADHTAAPTAVFDVHCRVGGATTGKTSSCVTVNSSHVIIDNTWLWRADHDNNNNTAGWTLNPANNGIIVNGDDVTVYGLFVEHFQQYQTLWNGERGAVYFYQSEMPYDPPNQAAWMAASGHDGYPSYKVADGVQTHHAGGIGVYSVFSNDVTAVNAIETPTGSGITMSHMVSVSLASGSITHIVNGTGGTVGNGGGQTAFTDY